MTENGACNSFRAEQEDVNILEDDWLELKIVKAQFEK